MSRTDKGIRNAFSQNTYVFVRVTPQGFAIEDDILTRLRGKIVKTTLLRKRFEDRVLVCDSADGQTARDGTLCAACRHTDCRPQLRIHLRQGSAVFLIDLATTSARNYLAIEDAVEAAGEQLEDCALGLEVIDHGHWGEVTFSRA